MIAFQAETEVTRDGGRLTAALSPEWGIWGPNGGVLSTIALRAAGLAAAPGHRPVTLSVQYLGRASFGAIEAVVEPVKTGGSACTNVRLGQAGRVFLQGQLWTTSREAGPDARTLQPPAMPPPDSLESFGQWQDRTGKPRHDFWRHFDAATDVIAGPPDPDPRGPVVRQWTRFLGWQPGADAFLDAGRAVLLIDTLIWPAFWRGQALDPAITAPSLDLTVWFHAPAGDADWLLADVAADTAHGGLIHGGARVWTEDGRLVASGGSQLIVLPNR